MLSLPHAGPAAQEVREHEFTDDLTSEALFAAADGDGINGDLPSDEPGSMEPGTIEPGSVEPDEQFGGRVEPEDALPAVAPEAAAQKRFRFSARLRTSAVADDNIFIQEKNKVSDFVLSVQPGFTFGYGDTLNRKENFVLFDYDANAMFFAENRDQNSLDHDAALRAQWHGSSLTLGGFLRFRSLTDVNVEIGDRLKRNVYEAGVYGRYELSDRTRLGSELSATKADYDRGHDYREFISRSFIDHDVGPRTTIGVGVTLGRLKVQGSGLQTYEQLLARAKYSAAAKLSFAVSGGVELRQLPGGDSQVTPVFNAQAAYTPYELLKFRFDTYRRVQPSIATAGQNTVVTGVSAGAEYRFLQRWQASVAAGYEHAQYERSGHGTKAPDRKDNYAFGRIGVDYSFAHNWRAGAFYSYRTNDSTRSGSSFDNNQVGLQSSVAF